MSEVLRRLAQADNSPETTIVSRKNQVVIYVVPNPLQQFIHEADMSGYAYASNPDKHGVLRMDEADWMLEDIFQNQHTITAIEENFGVPWRPGHITSMQLQVGQIGLHHVSRIAMKDTQRVDLVTHISRVPRSHPLGDSAVKDYASLYHLHVASRMIPDALRNRIDVVKPIVAGGISRFRSASAKYAHYYDYPFYITEFDSVREELHVEMAPTKWGYVPVLRYAMPQASVYNDTISTQQILFESVEGIGPLDPVVAMVCIRDQWKDVARALVTLGIAGGSMPDRVHLNNGDVMGLISPPDKNRGNIPHIDALKIVSSRSGITVIDREYDVLDKLRMYDIDGETPDESHHPVSIKMFGLLTDLELQQIIREVRQEVASIRD